MNEAETKKKNKLANQFNEKTNSNVFNSHSHTLLVRNSFLSFFYWPSSSTLMFIVILVVVINVLKKKKNTQIRKQDTNTHTHQTHIDKKIKIKNRREFRLLKLFLSVFSVCYVFFVHVVVVVDKCGEWCSIIWSNDDDDDDHDHHR